MISVLRACKMATIAGIVLSIGTIGEAQAQAPKNGTNSGWYSGFGSVKATPVGKERLLMSWEENGITVEDSKEGFLHQMTWHCWGINDFTGGMGALAAGYCVSTDPAGDQIVSNLKDAKHAIDANSWEGIYTFTGGTGKFAGISGGGTYVIQDASLRRTAVEGTYQSFNRYQGSWKLP